jgi:hypothetical protein
VTVRTNRPDGARVPATRHDVVTRPSRSRGLRDEFGAPRPGSPPRAVGGMGDIPRTTAGRRTIALPAFVVDLLERRRAQMPTAQGPPVIFPDPTGTSGSAEHEQSLAPGPRSRRLRLGELARVPQGRGDPTGRSGAVGPPDRRPPGAQPTEPDAGRLHGSRPREPGGGDSAAALTAICNDGRGRSARLGSGSAAMNVRCSGWYGGALKPLSCGVAPPIGLEPITLRLTVACSAN